MKHFVTFGQSHVHKINGKTIDNDCVVVFIVKNPEEGRDKAFQLFGPVFCFEYSEEEWNKKTEETKKVYNKDILDYFPRGYIFLD